MNPRPSPSPSTPQRTIFAKIRHAISLVPIPIPLKKRKWILLMTASLLLTAIFWLQRTPPNEELLAYRMGYGMGQALKAGGGKMDPEELAVEMRIDSGEWDMFEDGFSDGRKGRKARYEAPAHYGESGEGGAYEEPPSLEENHSESPAGDYAINSMYGEAPPKTESKQDTKE